MSGGPLLALFVSNLVWSAIGMLLVLAVRRPFAALFGAGPAYALWLLPALRLLAPPLPAWSLPTPPVDLPMLILVAEDAAAPMPSSGGPGQWVPVMLAAWAVGAAVFMLWQAWTYGRFLGALDRDARVLGAHRGIALVESPGAEGPLSLGLLRRRIFVPVDFEARYSPGERLLALDHEALHHRRLDLWWNHLALLVLAAHWFNPVAWIAFRAFRADQELACDAAIAAGADPEARHDYACALVKSASRPGLIAACPLNHADQLKRRLKMLKVHRSGGWRAAAGLSAVAMLAGLGVAATGGAAAAQASQPEPSAEQPEQRTDRLFFVLRDAPEGKNAAEEPNREIRKFTLRTPKGDGETMPGGMAGMAPPECQGAGKTEIEEGDARNRTHLVLCTDEAGTPAERADKLQRARDRFAKDAPMDAERRDRALALLDREIAKLRGQQ